MTKLNNEKLTNRVAELVAGNMDKAKIEATLTLEDYKKADIAEAFKVAGLKRTMSGFRGELYEMLTKREVKIDEAKALIKKQSANVKKHESHYLAIVELVNTAVKARTSK